MTTMCLAMVDDNFNEAVVIGRICIALFKVYVWHVRGNINFP